MVTVIFQEDEITLGEEIFGDYEFSTNKI